MRGILDKVMSLQDNASLSGQARARAIHGIIEVSFDFATMAKSSLASTLTASQGASDRNHPHL